MIRLKFQFIPIVLFFVALVLFGCSSPTISASSSASEKERLLQIKAAVIESGIYTTCDSVAAYLCKFDKLPQNYVDKDEGIALYEATGNTFTKWNFNPGKFSA